MVMVMVILFACVEACWEGRSLIFTMMMIIRKAIAKVKDHENEFVNEERNGSGQIPL